MCFTCTVCIQSRDKQPPSCHLINELIGRGVSRFNFWLHKHFSCGIEASILRYCRMLFLSKVYVLNRLNEILLHFQIQTKGREKKQQLFFQPFPTIDQFFFRLLRPQRGSGQCLGLAFIALC